MASSGEPSGSIPRDGGSTSQGFFAQSESRSSASRGKGSIVCSVFYRPVVLVADHSTGFECSSLFSSANWSAAFANTPSWVAFNNTVNRKMNTKHCDCRSCPTVFQEAFLRGSLTTCLRETAIDFGVADKLQVIWVQPEEYPEPPEWWEKWKNNGQGSTQSAR